MNKLILSFICVISLYAQNNFENSKFKQSFIDNGGELTPELMSIINKDAHFNSAILYLEKNLTTKTITFTDPENPKIEKKLEQIMPDYDKAYEEVKNSVNKYKNSASAYLGLHLIKTLFGKNKQLKEFKEYSELLYSKQKEICSVYIDYGETLEKGYYGKANIKRAKEVYEEGLKKKKCQEGWYFNVLSAKYETLKRVK